MVAPKRKFPDGKSALKERLGLGETTLAPEEESKVVERLPDVGMVAFEGIFPDRQ